MIKKQMFLLMCLCLMSVLASVGQAQLPEPVGLWLTLMATTKGPITFCLGYAGGASFRTCEQDGSDGSVIEQYPDEPEK